MAADKRVEWMTGIAGVSGAGGLSLMIWSYGAEAPYWPWPVGVGLVGFALLGFAISAWPAFRKSVGGPNEDTAQTIRQKGHGNKNAFQAGRDINLQFDRSDRPARRAGPTEKPPRRGESSWAFKNHRDPRWIELPDWDDLGVVWRPAVDVNNKWKTPKLLGPFCPHHKASLRYRWRDGAAGEDVSENDAIGLQPIDDDYSLEAMTGLSVEIGHLYCPEHGCDKRFFLGLNDPDRESTTVGSVKGDVLSRIRAARDRGEYGNVSSRSGSAGPPPTGAKVDGPRWPDRFVSQRLFEVTLDPAYISTPDADDSPITSWVTITANETCVTPIHLKVELPNGYRAFNGWFVRSRKTLVPSWHWAGRADGFYAEVRSPQFRKGDRLHLLVSGPTKLPAAPVVLVGAEANGVKP